MPGGIRTILERRIRLVLSLPLGLLGLGAAGLAVTAGAVYRAWVLGPNPEFVEPFAAGGIGTLVLVFRAAAGAVAAASLALAVLGRRQARRSLRLLRVGYVGGYVLAAAWSFVVIQAVNLIAAQGLRVGGEHLDVVDVFYLKASRLWPAVLLAAAFVVLDWLARRPWVVDVYAGRERSPAAEHLVISGRDPVFRRGLTVSLLVHFLVIIVLPWVLQGGGCVRVYRMPGGGGGGGGQVQEAQMVRILKARTKAKRKTYTLRLNSPISFYVPKIDEGEVLSEVDKATEHVYQATRTGLGEGKGKGFGKGPGSGGGWAGGDAAAGVLRFVRLQHGGRGWDDGMDETSRADLNFMDALRTITGLRVADKPESYPIYMLKQFNARNPLPFVYMTGDGDIPPPSPGDLKVLRRYLLEEGMLFADSASERFTQSVRFLAGRLFPEKSLVDIPNDDPIFQLPFQFSNGAPPLWHHGGSRALGVKHDGRWIVFLFPGDMNDAWKKGHSGAREDVVQQSFHMGANIVYHAYTNYAETHYPPK